MEKYVPATALGDLEIDSIPEVLDGLTGTRAWRNVGAALGLSSQLRDVGTAAELIGRTGLGPDEAVVAGRAQFALAVTDLESETGETPEGPLLHFKPRLA